jgi:PAS domain S-box-containing protein
MGNWEYDLATQMTTWSDEIYRLYDRDPALGPPPQEEQVSYYPPEQQEELMQAGSKAVDTGQESALDLEARLPSGRRAHFFTTMRPIKDARDQVVKLMGTIEDITERKKAEDELRRAHDELEVRVEQRTAELKEAESKYRDLVENANSIILELDTSGKISFLNRFAQDFFGFSEAETVGRHAVGTIIPPTDSEGNDLKVKIKDLTKHPEDHYASEGEGIRQDGKRVWISWTNKGLYDKKGRLRRILCIGMDRTEQRQGAATLAQEEKEKAAAAERQRLARDLHDAVTQTLFSASLIAEVLPRLWEKDHAEGERRLEELRRLTRGALAEMRMLLLELRPTALGEVGLTDLLRQLGEATTGRTMLPVALFISGQCTAPIDVQVALYRVAQEALNNVVKHSGATKANIRLRCREKSVDLTISDNGSGFDLQTVSPKSLGLRIMRERAEGAGAKLKIDSRAGLGTKVGVLWSDATREGG